jgi:RHS repeat-associated protein
MYQPELGRWNVVDPLGENHVSETPFSFSGNNPIMNIDPDGLDWYRHDETGAVVVAR